MGFGVGYPVEDVPSNPKAYTRLRGLRPIQHACRPPVSHFPWCSVPNTSPPTCHDLTTPFSTPPHAHTHPQVANMIFLDSPAGERSGRRGRERVGCVRATTQREEEEGSAEGAHPWKALTGAPCTLPLT